MPALDSPPPSPINPPTGPGGASSGLPAGGDAAGAGGGGGLKGATDLAQQVDQAISTLAAAFPQGADEFRQAKQLILTGMSKALSGLGQTSSSPTATGGQFPGAPGGAPPTGMPQM